MQGDFKVELDFECDISHVKSGWGQGLVLIVALDDPLATEMKICRLAIPKLGQYCQMEVSGQRIEKPTYKGKLTKINQGTLSIQRTGKIYKFLINCQAGKQEISEYSGSSANVRYVEIICTRQPGGNGDAKYVLKNLRLEADSFLSFEGASTSVFNWWTILLTAQVLVAMVLVWRMTKA